MDDAMLDCLVVGGGPAGLTAAIYLSRFYLKLKVIDAGKSRASLIPCTRNHAGFPDGISGQELVDRMKAQAQKYGASIESGRVARLDRVDGGFEAHWGGGSLTARSVLLATGVSNRRPPMDEQLHDEALAQGLIRYCPICDGYEVTDKKIGVIGSGGHGVAEAIFLRAYTSEIVLIAPDKAHDIATDQQAELQQLGIRTVDGPCQAVAIDGSAITVATMEGSYTFDSVYPALGSDTHIELAQQAGAAISKENCILVDEHQRTNVPGLYAAGDVVLGLDQISNAMGQGGIAATAIRNDLARQKPLLR
jgi:thioredoxin reductase (NADPH)